MSNYEEVLMSVGHTNSLGKAGEILSEAREDNSKIPELFRCISSDDAWVRMRAIDTFEKLVREKPSLAEPYLQDIFGILTQSSQPSIQWHLAQVFSEVDLDKQQREAAIEWLQARVKTNEVDWIVSVNAMKTLLKFSKEGLVEASSLKPYFKTQLEHKSPSVRKKAKAFLEQLD